MTGRRDSQSPDHSGARARFGSSTLLSSSVFPYTSGEPSSGCLRGILLASQSPDEMRLSRPILQSLAFTMVLLFPAVRTAAADSLTEGTRQIVAQIAARLGPGADAAVTVRNLSSISAAQFADIQRDLEAQFHATSLHLVPPEQAAAEVLLTLSENLEGYLWVAEIRKGETPQVIMVSMPRPPVTARAASQAALVLQKNPLWEQDAPMLDVAVLHAGGGKTQLLILEPERVVLRDLSPPAAQQTQPIVRSSPWPRDPRGRLVLRQDHLFDAYLPGTRCSSVGQGLTSLSCVATDDPWPVDPTLNAFFASSRNFFTGILSGTGAQGKTTAPFFSAAQVEDNGAVVWVFAGVDGRVRLFRGAGESVEDFKSWGSDIAALKTACGSQVLATHAGESGAQDTVQAFQISGQQAVPVSQPADFAGPVTALWPATDGTNAIAIAHNLKAGRYEAYSLTITCEH